jgi:hypothetical protein
MAVSRIVFAILWLYLALAAACEASFMWRLYGGERKLTVAEACMDRLRRLWALGQRLELADPAHAQAVGG